MNLANICQQVRDISVLARKFIVQQAEQFDVSKIEIKGLNDLVSYVDKETEAMIVKLLMPIIPEAKFIAEENPDFKALTSEPYHWIIDPLDGTTNFLHGLPI